MAQAVDVLRAVTDDLPIQIRIPADSDTHPRGNDTGACGLDKTAHSSWVESSVDRAGGPLVVLRHGLFVAQRDSKPRIDRASFAHAGLYLACSLSSLR